MRALEILDAAGTLGDGNPLMFPMRRGTPISASTLPKMLLQHRIAAVAHGFRSSFRDWAAEETNHPREVVEAALAHVVQNKVEAVYARSDLFERRRQLMGDWAATISVGNGGTLWHDVGVRASLWTMIARMLSRGRLIVATSSSRSLSLG